jgi:hypothetical protein
MKDIETLAEVHEALQQLGYKSRLGTNSVAVRVGGRKHPFPAVITHNTTTKHFQITCMVAKMGEIPEDRLTAFALAALDANNHISPFAYALITDTDDPKLDDENEWPVVLVCSVPIGDFSVGELSSAMQSLLAALIDSRNVLESIKTDALAPTTPAPAKAAKKESGKRKSTR